MAIEDDHVAVGPVVVPGVHADFLSSRAAVWALAGEHWRGRNPDAQTARFVAGTCDEVEPWMIPAAYDQTARLVLALLTRTVKRTTYTTLIQQTGFRPIDFPLAPSRAGVELGWTQGMDGSGMGFIVGSQRSGTTMLGNYLSRNYNVSYADEDQAVHSTRLVQSSGSYKLFDLQDSPVDGIIGVPSAPLSESEIRLPKAAPASSHRVDAQSARFRREKLG